MSDPRPKQRYLVIYDYGQGGVWAFVWARSAEDIHRTFRDLKVMDTMPSWLEGQRLEQLENRMTFDIDDVHPGQWLARFLKVSPCSM